MEITPKKGIMYVYKLATGDQTPTTDVPEKAKKAHGIWQLRKSKTYRENDRTVGIFNGKKPSPTNIEGQEENCSGKNFEGRKSPASNIETQGGQNGNFKIFEGRKSYASNMETQGGQNYNIKIFEGRKSYASNMETQGGQNSNIKIFEGRTSCTSNFKGKGGQDGNIKISEGRKSLGSNMERQRGKDGNLKIFEGRKLFASNVERKGGQDGNINFFEGRKSVGSNMERQGGQDGNFKIFEGRKSSASNIEGKGGQYGNFKFFEGRKSVSDVEEIDSLAVAKFLQVKMLVSDMPGFMLVHAFRCARKTYDNLEKFSSKHMAYNMKKEFDKVYGAAWHCIVGSNFGSFVTHSNGCFLYFSIHNIYILIFKTKVQRALH